MEDKITKYFDFGGYEQTIKFIEKSKLIYFIDCTCGDFSGAYSPKKEIKKICSSKNLCNDCEYYGDLEGCGKEFIFIKEAKWFPGRRITKVGQVLDIKYVATPCKHLLPLIKIYESEGFNLKTIKPMIGTDKCSPVLRRIIFNRSKGICEVDKCENKGFEIHRKIPATNGGKYNEENCILICPEHHKLITYQKWQNSPGAKNGKR